MSGEVRSTPTLPVPTPSIQLGSNGVILLSLPFLPWTHEEKEISFLFKMNECGKNKTQKVEPDLV